MRTKDYLLVNLLRKTAIRNINAYEGTNQITQSKINACLSKIWLCPLMLRWPGVAELLSKLRGQPFSTTPPGPKGPGPQVAHKGPYNGVKVVTDTFILSRVIMNDSSIATNMRVNRFFIYRAYH